jgi:hypothetical protein
MLRRATAVLAIGVAALAAAAVVHVRLGSQDAAPPDDADLAIAAPPVPDSANGFHILATTIGSLSWSEADDERLKAMRLRGEFDEPFVRELVSRNDRALAGLDSALAAPAFASPPMERIDGAVPDFESWIRIGQIAGYRAGLRAQDGDLAGALDGARVPLRFANRVLADPSAVLVHAMVSTRIKTSATWAFQTALAWAAPTAEQSREVARRIGAERIDPGSWRAMWAREYALEKAALRAPTLDPGMRAEWPPFLPESYLYHENATVSLFADLTRELQSYAAGPCSAIRAPLPGPSGTGLALDALLRPNAMGRATFAESSRQLRYYELRRCRSDADLAALQALVGLRAWLGRHETLPPNLDALVPEFLDAVPADPYGDRPLGYDAELRRLSSVGSRLDVDSGEAAAENPAFAREASWNLPF